MDVVATTLAAAEVVRVSTVIGEYDRWLFEEGQISWDEVMVRWKGRGPSNQEFVGSVQRGYDELYGNGDEKLTWREIVQ